ncbi:septal ring lytic transglycosylase RlpA family protein [Bdellovibrio svalbardensis]|uniref:Probable endolytic peptidoglycan transglycosylase RlpA n=1 Tax=Bdellovibrio svalbardensis TaxID=2972972 RepID=A0ABT6DL39_9BACT|nr:septal ring lytic transglycosylase RlpA family protein [Bdellovibrio svalbardensis]MDG0817232.1 septal ring lytic transglycosylase RlpA family protein [Bdellovibrio svalbardensis]
MRSLNLIFFFACTFILSSCANFPLRRDAFYEKGPASWYGKEFNGRMTANGERFNMFELTAAHRTLPFGKQVKVTSLSTGRTVIVRINDRGPYHGNRIIDLSYAAAKRLKIVNKGEEQVTLQVL